MNAALSMSDEMSPNKLNIAVTNAKDTLQAMIARRRDAEDEQQTLVKKADEWPKSEKI
jgi:hypothetical protein